MAIVLFMILVLIICEKRPLQYAFKCPLHYPIVNEYQTEFSVEGGGVTCLLGSGLGPTLVPGLCSLTSALIISNV